MLRETIPFQGLLADGVSLLPGLQRNPLDGVGLHEAVEVLRIAPQAVVGVVAGLAGVGVEDQRVEPAGQPDEQAVRLPLEQPVGPERGLGQAVAAAGGADGDRVADLGLEAHDVRQGRVLPADCDAG